MTHTTAILDVGKTNVKLLVFRESAVVFQRTRPNAVVAGPPYPHFDVDALWRFCLDALGAAAREHAIDRLAVTTHGASVALVGETDLAAPIMDYEFAGPDADEADYAPVRPPFSETLTPAMPGGLNWARQVFHIQRHHPDLFARTKNILMYPQYFGWRFTGVARNEVTNLACHSDAWNPRLGTYSGLVDRLGWSALLPPIVPAWEILGPIKPELAAETGLRPGLPVLAGLHDSNASLVPHLLALPAPFSVVSTGTWVVIVGVGAPLDRVSEAAGTMANVDVEGRPGPVARFMGGREFALLTEGGQENAGASDLADVLSSGAMVLPGADPATVQRRIVGTLPSGAGARAALATLYQALRSDAELDGLGVLSGPVVVEGPFAENPLFCSILASLRPRQAILVDQDSAGAAYGTALLADWPRNPIRRPLVRAAPITQGDALARYRASWYAANSARGPQTSM